MTPTTIQYSPVPIANSELRHIESSVIGQEYQINIRLPEDYANTITHYPVLYLLDGDHAFAMATDIVQYLIYGEHIPDLVIVSPAYGSKKAPHEGGKNWRNRDLVPFPLSFIDMTPGGDRYLEFIQQELIPFAESNYRVLPNDRTLWGYSLGGLFAFHAMFQKPDLFQRYIIVDGFDEKYFETEERFAAQHTDLPIRLFLSASPVTLENELARFLTTLQNRNYPTFRSEYASLNEMGHFVVGAEGLAKGLVSVFRQ